MKSIFVRIYLIFFLIAIEGCTVNGKHIYVGDECLSCINNPITGKAVNYKQDDLKKSDHPDNSKRINVLSWEKMVIEELKEKQVSDASIYADAYLRFISYPNYQRIRTNEFSYKRDLKKAQKELENKIRSSNAYGMYQVTLPSRLKEYDFISSFFPVDHPASVSGTPAVPVGVGLPNKVVVVFDNSDSLPGWIMSEQEADHFLSSRNNNRNIYVRYIINIHKYIGPSMFSATVKEVHFISISPNLGVSRRKENLPPTKIIKVE